jgi:UDP-glucose 4-epimerase
MLQGAQPTIFGDGETSRDFTHVDDAVAANLLACRAPADQVAGRVFNVATGRRATLNDTFRILKKITDYRGDPKYGPERTGDVKHSLADISKAREHLGYEPRVDFEQGLKATVEWYREPVPSHGQWLSARGSLAP